MLGCSGIGYFTVPALQALPSLSTVAVVSNMPQLLDRHGNLLDTTIERGWNTHDQVDLHQIPDILQKAFVLSEDKRFHSHHGVDWWARWHALWQTLLARANVRGASTITEQVVRMVHPRKRTLWSKWLEGLEAGVLDQQESKWNILEFYLNQLPYGAERRGLLQAARYYFDRDLDTLSLKEMLALVVLARAPSVYAAERNAPRLEKRILQLASRLEVDGLITPQEYHLCQTQLLQMTKSTPISSVFHFAQQVWKNTPTGTTRVHTTLDGALQQTTTQLLNERLAQLADKNVQNGSVLVVDHQQHEILAWAVSGDIARRSPGAFIDSVITPRQPGSTLKPFVYALALEKGWTAATQLKDAPLDTAVGHGLHSYRNFSRVFYGDITLREALANSLNIPAVKALEFVGMGPALERMQRLGMQELSKNPAIYGEGLALGNGEISLFELVQAYTALADRGNYQPLRFLLSDKTVQGDSVFSAEISSIISNILADAPARQLEFGGGSSLSFPVETAAKTGTSTDNRDAWIVAYNHRYLVGIWMGNLNRQPMRDVTGSNGPALLAHSIFSVLNRDSDTKPLYLSSTLIKSPVCQFNDKTHECSFRDEWFVPGTEPVTTPAVTAKTPLVLKIGKPSDGLMLAMDPRVPDTLEAFEFSLNQPDAVESVTWVLDGQVIAQTATGKYSWTLVRGEHLLYAKYLNGDSKTLFTDTVAYTVK